MRKILFLIFIVFCNLVIYGQDDGFIKNYQEANAVYYADSVLIVSYHGIDKNNIASAHLVKEKTVVNGKEYGGKFYLKLKQRADLLSLEQVCQKYIREKIYAPIYLINGNFIKGDISSVKIDNNFILRVNYFNSDQFDGFDEKKSPKFTFILIFTQTEENIKRANTIRIR
jgi:hypothetical protein